MSMRAREDAFNSRHLMTKETARSGGPGTDKVAGCSLRRIRFPALKPFPVVRKLLPGGAGRFTRRAEAQA